MLIPALTVIPSSSGLAIPTGYDLGDSFRAFRTSCSTACNLIRDMRALIASDRALSEKFAHFGLFYSGHGLKHQFEYPRFISAVHSAYQYEPLFRIWGIDPEAVNRDLAWLDVG